MTVHSERGDSGTQPTPHYCTRRLAGGDAVTGCPDWPECLFPGSRDRAASAWNDSVEVERARFAADVASHLPEHAFTHALVETLFWVVLVGMLFGLLWVVLA